MRPLLIAATVVLLAACSDKQGASPAPPTAAQAATAISGEEVFATCSACHSREAGGAQGMGPNLHQLIGRKAGSNAGFAYSPALKASDITWTAETLDTYLAAPSRAVPGTRMAMAVPDAARRKAVIEYLSAP